jgi:hypothetical protein
MRRITQKDFKFLDQLIERSILLDPVAVAEAKIASADLQIIPDGDYLEDEFALEVGGRFATRFSISARVVINNKPDRQSVRLGDEPISVVLPFNSDFHLLAADEARAVGRYVLTPCGRQFPMESALNHKVQPGQVLRPGQKLEGLLIGEGTAFTPLGYTIRELVPIQVIVHTEEDETYSARIALCVSHYKTKSVAQNSIPRRGSLFAKKDLVPLR